MDDENSLPLAAESVREFKPVPSESESRQLELELRSQEELDTYTQRENVKPTGPSGGSGDGCRSSHPQLPRFAPSEVAAAVPASTIPQPPPAASASSTLLTPVPLELKKRCDTA